LIKNIKHVRKLINKEKKRKEKRREEKRGDTFCYCVQLNNDVE